MPSNIRIQGFFPVAGEKVLKEESAGDIFLSPSVYRHTVRELDITQLVVMEDVEKFMCGSGWDFADVVAVADLTGDIPLPFYVVKEKIPKLIELINKHKNRYTITL
jgi:hypothetical protein